MKRLSIYLLAVVATLSILVTHGMTSVTVVQVVPTPQVFPTWTDTERRFSGNAPILRCTYHESNGTARVVEVIGNGTC